MLSPAYTGYTLFRDVVDLDSIDRTSMACPALPTCGLAVAESERSLPDINLRIRALMTKLGFDEGESFVVRMTGDSQAPKSICCSVAISATVMGLVIQSTLMAVI